MEDISNEMINQAIGLALQKARLKKGLTQEQLAEELSKSSKTISQIETGKDGTSKKTDIEFMNVLEITPNQLYKDLISNPNLKNKIALSEKIDNLSPEKLKALYKIIDIIINEL